MTAAALPFVRDRFTWLTYLTLAYGTYMVSALGPLMPFLAADLGLSYTVRGLHTSAYAIGAIITGAFSDRFAHLIGRGRMVWLGGGGMAAGAVIMMAARTPVLTIAAAFVMGFLGTIMFIMAQASMADHHAERRGLAISESNVISSIAGMLAPLLISQAEGIGLGWRAAILLGAGLWAVMAFSGRRITVPDAPHTPVAHTGDMRLPRLYWIFWLIMLLGVAVEWSVSFWSAEFFERVVGVDRVTASGLLTFYWLAVLVGRILGSFLARRARPTTLLIASAAIATAAFPVLWTARDPGIGIAALFVIGLGVGNFFPMILAAATTVGAHNTNAAAARIALANGVAILLAPQILGSVADQVGIEGAFALIGALLLGVLVLTLASRWVQRYPRWKHTGR